MIEFLWTMILVVIAMQFVGAGLFLVIFGLVKLLTRALSPQ